jgi:hypothetical protein
MTMNIVTRLLLLLSLTGLMLAPASAQVRAVDPNTALSTPAASTSTPRIGDINTKLPGDSSVTQAATDAAQNDLTPATGDAALSNGTSYDQPNMAVANDTAIPAAPATSGTTYRKDDVIGAAEGVFGKGAEGLAGIVEKILKDQGEPNAYIAGREASGAFVVGLRYGSGTMSHTVEGTRPVYWTGPSIGFDVGGDATKVFVLVYNLYDSQELYRRYPQAEGRAYFVGGFSATYLRRGSVVMIPIRLGVGVRLGANIGYMKFSEKSRWLPF